MTRVLVIADMHCGHKIGLTPPDWDTRPGDAYGTKAYEFYRDRRDMWKWYAERCEGLKPDILIVNGDCIDGRGDKSGGTELLTRDIDEQCEMAIACIKETGAPRIVMSYGTPYHVGKRLDKENYIAKGVEAEKIGSEDDIKVHGVVINYKHKVGRSSIPYGKGTPISKTRFWNLIWAERGEYPKANILVRSHNHYLVCMRERDYTALSTPALQGYGTKYGAREMEGTVDFGVVWFDIEEDGSWGWDYDLKTFRRRHGFALEV